ncbi:MAG TPA: VWA domain-containing protein [Vicinamibacterales bacterium]|nr:VWA domain-containing protein [Vicinamibacterales bacterium]
MQRICIALCLAAGLAAGLSAQQQPPPQPAQQTQQPPRFRVEINYVEIDAVVTDAQGTFVRDLRREDFEVLEDGKPQQVTAFSVVDVPIERADVPLLAPEVAPDVASNEREFNGRIYILILDDLHTAALRSQRVRAGARQFIERYVGANDLAAVVTTGGNTRGAQEFTSSKPLLLRAVDNFIGQKLRSATAEKLDEYYRMRGTPMANDPLRDPFEFERAAKARNMLDTLTNVSRVLGAVQGRRKAVVLFGEGIDYDINNPFEAQFATSIRDDLREAIAAATRSNVTIYSVDARGLTTMGDESMDMASPPEDPSLRLDSRGLQEELRLSQDSLRSLADQTGGFALVNTNDFRNGFERIQRDNSTYYLLGYYSSNERLDGRYRRITVRVKRPGLEVRARRGYVAPRSRDANNKLRPDKSGLSAELTEALSSPVPVSGLPLTVTAAPFKGTAPDASVLVTIELGGRQLPFTEREGVFQNALEVTTIAVDERGNVHGPPPATVSLNLTPRTHEAVVTRGFRVTQRLSLKAGRYTLRIGAREQKGGAIGTIAYDLEVPNFFKAPLSMSGVVLTSRAAGARPTASPDPELKEILPGPPTAIREFSREDTLGVFAEVYDNQASTPHRIDITATIKADGGRSMVSQSEERSTEELQGARGGFGYRTDIPLQDLEPGSYVLTVEARSRLSGNPTVREDIPFRVRGRT